jgi:hypothetical protein
VELSPGAIRRGNAEKKSQKRANTRENGQTHASTLLWVQPAAHAQLVVLSMNFWCCSFSPMKVSQKCSQLIHIRFVPSSPAGLRLETGLKIDKKKMNFIFNCRKKIS